MGLTQLQLANLSSLSQSLIAKIESGRLDPSFSNALRISETIQTIQRKSSKKAEDVMSKEIVYISAGSSLKDAAELMHSNSISQIPVYESSQPVGNISEKTVLRLLSEGEGIENMFKKKVRDVMDDSFPTVNRNTPVGVIYGLLEFFQAVLVMNREKVVGIISKADLLNPV